MGKRQIHSKTPQTRAKRSAPSQQATTRHIQTDAHKGTDDIIDGYIKADDIINEYFKADGIIKYFFLIFPCLLT